MTPIGDKNVEHEQGVADAVDDQMARTSNQAAIANAGAPGASYVQAEAAAVQTKLNQVLQVLRDAELIPT